MVTCDTKLEEAEVSRQDLSIGITFHHLGLILAATAGLTSLFTAFYLIIQHARHYSQPSEQKHIIRILFMIPVYSTVSFLSYLNYKHAIYYEVIRDCYEAFAIASFFTLLCNYIAPSLHDQKEYFRNTNPKNWLWPLTWCQKCTGGQEKGVLRKPRSGLTWFNIIYLGVFQYCLIRVLFTIVSVASQAGGRYCENSLNPAFAHIWVMVFEGVSVTFAMYALIQFYHQTRQELAHQRPFMKLLCIKLVIFFCFWQSLLIDFLSSSQGPLQSTPKFAYPDISTGIPSMLICLEMAIFAILHLFAFPWRKTYGPQSAKGPELWKAQGGPYGLYAYTDAFNPWDILKAVARGFRWLVVGRRQRKTDRSYQKDAWSGGGAFDRPSSQRDDYCPSGNDATTNLHVYGPPKRFNTIPLKGGPAKFMSPSSLRRGASRMNSEQTEDNVWANQDLEDELGYDRPPAAGRQESWDMGAEDRAGLLRHPARPGRRTGISPAGSEVGASPERRQDRSSSSPTRYSSAFDKEAGIEEQYKGYGRQSWGKGSRVVYAMRR